MVKVSFNKKIKYFLQVRSKTVRFYCLDKHRQLLDLVWYLQIGVHQQLSHQT